jgi:hypothetical protein
LLQRLLPVALATKQLPRHLLLSAPLEGRLQCLQDSANSRLRAAKDACGYSRAGHLSAGLEAAAFLTVAAFSFSYLGIKPGCLSRSFLKLLACNINSASKLSPRSGVLL